MDPDAFARLSNALSDRYRFDREIGRGGGGCVWIARDLARDRSVAIKCMTVGTTLLTRRDRFHREILVEAKLAHPHIVPLFDSGEIGEIVYLVMPYVDGGSLEDRLAREGALPVRDALRVALEVAQALAYAHAQGVVHRDIKPGNILFLAGHAQVADFGIARLFEPDRAHQPRTTDMVPLGTPHYMAPEQADGVTAVDGRADIYSLGCVLYEMLVGHPPFEGPNSEVLLRHALDPVPPIRSVRPTVTPAAEAVALHALAKRPADRFPNGAAMAEAIEAALTAEPESGPTHFPTPRPAPSTRWRRASIAAATIVLAAAGTSAIGVQRETARLIAKADTARIVLFPLEIADSGLAGGDERLRRAFATWNDVSIAEPFAVREAVGDEPLTMDRTNRIALRLHAGRFVRGTVAPSGSGREVRLVLWESGRRPRALHEEVGRLALEDRALDSTLTVMVERLLLRAPLPPELPSTRLSTRSMAALQAYRRGRDAVTRWELDSAVAAFESAWATDRYFGSAGLWLAMTKYWSGARPTEWTYAALAAQRDSVLMTTREAGAASAMVATAYGDLVRACAEWDALARRQRLDFVGSYGGALCRDQDKRVQPDPRSPSGWSFRSSYHTALTQYVTAYGLMRPIHRSLGVNSFERVRQQLVVRGGYTRTGESADGAFFLAAPRLVADTLVFVPYPEMSVMLAEPATITDREEDRRLEKRQRELFRSLTSMWASDARSSAEAREALALALQLLGDPTALDTMQSAVSIEGQGARRFRFASTLAWMQLAFALPDDWSALRRATTTTDSVLARDTSTADVEMRVGLAAMFGRSDYVLRKATATSVRVDRRLPPVIAEASRALIIVAAMGLPAATIAAHERRVDSLVIALVPPNEREDMRGEVFGRAARLAWHVAPLSAGAMASVRRDYLVPLLAASSRGDTTALRPMLVKLREMRVRTPPADVAIDAVLPEAALLARHGEAALAAAWLDEAIAAVRTSAPNFEPVRAAALARCVALRADIASQLGKPLEAKRWAGAFVELWDHADPALQPLVARMRALAR